MSQCGQANGIASIKELGQRQSNEKGSVLVDLTFKTTERLGSEQAELAVCQLTFVGLIENRLYAAVLSWVFVVEAHQPTVNDTVVATAIGLAVETVVSGAVKAEAKTEWDKAGAR